MKVSGKILALLLLASGVCFTMACYSFSRVLSQFQPTATLTASPTPSATFTPSATVTFTASPTPTQTASPTATETATPTITATQQERTATPTFIWFQSEPGQFRLPPQTMAGNAHLWFGKPIYVGNASAASAYRFGMTFGYGALRPHHGIDLANPQGTQVVALGSGTVFYAGSDLETVFGPRGDFYGNVVVIQANETYQGRAVYYLYGHLHEVLVQSGQVVAEGEVVATVGSTGIAPAPHLHVEIRLDDPYNYNAVRNPELWIRPLPGYGVLAGRVLNAQGQLLPGVKVQLDCADGAPRFVETYWETSTPPDDELVENFVVGDLPVGYCDLSAEVDGQILRQDDVFIEADVLAVAILQVGK